MENVTSHRDIKLAATKKRRNCLVSEPNDNTTKLSAEHLLAIEMKHTQILMDKEFHCVH